MVRRANDTVTKLMQAGRPFTLVMRPGTDNIPSMIGADNQVQTTALQWLERGCFALGGLGILTLGTMRITSGAGLAFPQSMLWVGACTALAAGCALLYWRLTTRMPQSQARKPS